jgi:uncharacterized LabA/DUF88 family protein
MPEGGDAKSVAVFLDAENLIFGAKEQLQLFDVGVVMKRAKEEGRVVFAKAYGDFSKDLGTYVPLFQAAGVQMQLLASSARGKNTADIMLAIEALEFRLSPHAADVFVIGSADRDFVPLVQKLKRYGATVIGVGIEGSTSNELKDSCDQYIYYESLIQRVVPVEATDPKSQQARRPSSVESAPSEIEAAIALLIEAIRAVQRRSPDPQLSQVREMMQSLDPGFAYEAIGFQQFIDFCKYAQSGGYVKIEPYKDTGHLIRLGEASATVLATTPVRVDLDYSTVEAALKSYQELLRRKRVPLVRWTWRKQLVEHLWQALHKSGGMTIVDMNDVVAQEATRLGLSADLSKEHFQKLTMTLNIAQCFIRMNGTTGFEADILNVRLAARYELDHALDEMNEVYVNGIRFSDPEAPLIPEAVATLLFDEPTGGQMEWTKALIGRMRGSVR